MSGRFEGAWRVRETVFSSAGERLGEVVQRRALEALEGGELRVVQHNVPDAGLARHPMARFAGDHEFRLRREGAVRRYLGPAVVGSALAIGDGALVGRGLWPAFGWSFSSFSVLVAPDRQLTGGRFFRAGSTMATIVGVAAPERDGELASLGAPCLAGELHAAWSGSFVRVAGDGRPMTDGAARRRYDASGAYHEEGPEALHVRMRARDGALALEGSLAAEGRTPSDTLSGLAIRCGGLLESEAVIGSSTLLESVEVVDAERGHLVVLRRWIRDQVLRCVDVVRLRPEERKA